MTPCLQDPLYSRVAGVVFGTRHEVCWMRFPEQPAAAMTDGLGTTECIVGFRHRYIQDLA